MIYLDYSATTKMRKEVLDTYIKVNEEYFANPNSLHKIGVEAKRLIDASTKQIADILKVKPEEIIYTSCASESNNLAIKGVALRNIKKGKHIITTNLEHSSIYGPIDYLKKQGFEIEYLKTNNGLIDLDDLKQKLKEDTILVSIGAVNSETGVKQKIEEIASFLKQNSKCYFHVDATQSIGKVKIDFKNVDLISFSSHKFYGPKGIGVLVKKENVLIEPLIHGGKSTTIYRSGTPATPLIASTAKALRLIDSEQDDAYLRIEKLNKKICEYIKKYPNVIINSNEYSIPHILNISILTSKPESIQHAFEQYDIYISTKSACSTKNNISKSVLEVTNNEHQANHSVRISLSLFTTEEEIDKFLEVFDKVMEQFSSLYH